MKTVLKQMNSKLKQDNYRVSLPHLKNTMIVGMDAIHLSAKRLIGLSASYNQAKTQYYTRLYVEPNPKKEDTIKMSKDEQEQVSVEYRSELIKKFLKEALVVYRDATKVLFLSRLSYTEMD